MKRLTYFSNGHWRLDYDGVQYSAGFVDRLADYEDPGLAPEEIKNLYAEWSVMIAVLNSIGGGGITICVSWLKQIETDA